MPIPMPGIPMFGIPMFGMPMFGMFGMPIIVEGAADKDTRICRSIMTRLFIFSTAICAAADTSNSTNLQPKDETV